MIMMRLMSVRWTWAAVAGSLKIVDRLLNACGVGRGPRASPSQPSGLTLSSLGPTPEHNARMPVAVLRACQMRVSSSCSVMRVAFLVYIRPLVSDLPPARIFNSATRFGSDNRMLSEVIDPVGFRRGPFRLGLISTFGSVSALCS